MVFLEQGKASQALAYLDKALEFDPEHEQALLNSAILLQELGRAELRKVARERLLKLLRKVSCVKKSDCCSFIRGINAALAYKILFIYCFLVLPFNHCGSSVDDDGCGGGVNCKWSIASWKLW